MTVLPTLQKSIRRAFLRLVLLFGLPGLMLVAGLFFAGRLPTLLVRMNYDSIAYARLMEHALDVMPVPKFFASDSSKSLSVQGEAMFSEALAQAAENITEEHERKVIESIRSSWIAFQAHPNEKQIEELRSAIDRLVEVNEQGMFQRLDKNARFRDLVILGAATFFSVGILWAFILADSVAARISHPLRRVAEVFKDHPRLDRGLPLPEPQTLEVRILFDELKRMWNQLGALDALNVENLVTEKRKLEVILESAEDAVLVLDTSGCVAHVSARMLSLLGLREENVRGKPWRDLSTLSSNYLALRSALRPELQGATDITLQTDGEEQLYTARRRILLGSGSHTDGQVFLLSNITEKRRRDALRSEMMDWISHELKTPMQSLGLAADLLSRRTDLDEEMQMLVDTVRQDAARLRIVARQFMDLARMSPLALQLSLEQVDLRQVLPDWLKPFRLTAREAGIRLGTAFPEEKMEVTLDRERFAWVVSNLVANALRVCPEGSEINIALRREKENDECGIVLQVEDDGPGIAPELESRLFQPFSHGRTAGRQEGLVGLGLAIASTIVEAHGGNIQYSRRKSGGSLFTVRLPCSEPISHTATGEKGVQR